MRLKLKNLPSTKCCVFSTPLLLMQQKYWRNGEKRKRKRCHAMQNHELCSTSLHGRAGREGRHACRQNGPHISGGWKPSRNNIHIEDIPGTNATMFLPKCLRSGGWKPSRNNTYTQRNFRDQCYHVPSKVHRVPCPLLLMTGKLATVLRNRNFLLQRNRNRNLITDLSGTGTVIKRNHESSHKHNLKIVYLISFIEHFIHILQ